mmetsp:Transcript_51503/g.62068  ORF Transcript_51503/g.62068 Transcript_51503/m.62068 type:complete len:518 (-) Transcript_51503:108-1661(-)
MLRLQSFLTPAALILGITADTTENGCKCLNTWSYNNETFTSHTCGNPDDDTRGPWCFIESGSCDGPCYNKPSANIDGMDYDYCPRDYSDNEDISLSPGELVGLWQGDRYNVMSNGNSKRVSLVDVSLCATIDSPRLAMRTDRIDDNPDSGMTTILTSSTETHVISQVLCTGPLRGYYYSSVPGVAGPPPCHKFVLDPKSDYPSRTLNVTYVNVGDGDASANDCGAIDEPGSKLKVSRFKSTDNQVNENQWLCQPRLAPAELLGEWIGTKKMWTLNSTAAAMQGDDLLSECSVRMALKLNSNGWMLTLSDKCKGLVGAKHKDEGAAERRSDVIFDAHVEDCTATSDSYQENVSTGTLMAYSDGREYCYRFQRSGDKLRLAYVTTKHPLRKHHNCPADIVVARDVAVIELQLASSEGTVLPEDWHCHHSHQEMRLASFYEDDGTDPYADLFLEVESAGNTEARSATNAGVIVGIVLGSLAGCALILGAVQKHLAAGSRVSREQTADNPSFVKKQDGTLE